MQTTKTKHILIVDDNKDFADVFCDILKVNNYKCDSCYSGTQAISKVNKGEYDTVFIDIRMPDMDGVETLKEIRKINPDLKVIMMTGYSVDEMVQEALTEKASDVIYKPFEINKVLSLLNK